MQPKPQQRPPTSMQAEAQSRALAPANGAGADLQYMRVRLACIVYATVCFAAAAGLEGLQHDNYLLAAVPGTLAAAVMGVRAAPSLALTPPLELGDVEVRDAPGKGEGLFAARDIRRGTFVMDYLGEELDADAVNARYPNLLDARYLLGLRGPWGLEETYVDAANPARSNLGRYINHARLPNLRKVRQRWPTRALRFYAERDIEA
eukprot:CAMPEP_0119268286 /NCGR_PEP_ID=MMETSP1329-20130426/6118_1 /TAXON_ID=114041 /ORGANISM="Genus nov. species nov., Strain RCC1024" /LENGTH=204 /DNA_ID=CAMNT_0007268249 /DNA_START=161 /DNA_END=771 /DNA_ORIENTATION=+